MYFSCEQVDIMFRKQGTRLDHQGIKIEFIGQIGMLQVFQ